MTRPWQTLETLETRDGRLALRQRGEDDFLIQLDGQVLMNSAWSLSEKLLARAACERIADRPRPRVLLAGLGLGHSLRAALDALPAGARIVVRELCPEVVAWCRGPLAPAIGHALGDPRVELGIGDVAEAIRAAAGGGGGGRFDAIILDLFEGPHEDNPSRTRPFFGREALGRARRALAPGGILAIWSEDPYPLFERRLVAAGFRFERLRATTGPRHVVYLATLPAPVVRPGEKG